jgi:hypothetical protein
MAPRRQPLNVICHCGRAERLGQVGRCRPPRLLADFIVSDVGQNYASLRAMFEGLAVRDGHNLLAWVDELLVLLERDIR